MDKDKVNYKSLAEKIIEELVSSQVIFWHFNSKNKDEVQYIDRFRYITKEKFEKKVKYEIDKFTEETTSIEFEASMRKIFASLRDAHTVFGGWYPGKDRLDCRFVIIDNQVYSFNKNSYIKVLKINEVSICEILDKVKELISYEVEPWRLVQTEIFLLSPLTYQMIKATNKNIDEILIEGMDENGIIKKVKVGLRENTNNGQSRGFNAYEFKMLPDDKLYINYRVCRSFDNYPFEKFIEDIKNAVGDKQLKGVILDVRENGGGNSEVIKPLIKYLKNYQLNSTNTVVLAGAKTFSAGTFAVDCLKDTFNAKLVGEPLGQSAERYGQNSIRKEIEGFTYCMSAKFFDKSDTYKTRGIIYPDILIKTTLEDYTNKKDRQLETAIDYIIGAQNKTVKEGLDISDRVF